MMNNRSELFISYDEEEYISRIMNEMPSINQMSNRSDSCYNNVLLYYDKENNCILSQGKRSEDYPNFDKAKYIIDNEKEK